MPDWEPLTSVVHDPERTVLELGLVEVIPRAELERQHLLRRLFSELLGTFMLVLVAAGGGILRGQGQISLAAAVVAPGLIVLAIILFMARSPARI